MPEGLRSSVSLSPERAALDFARRLPDGAVVAVALSGGGDSVGLLVALHEAFRSEGRGLRLTAVTVDHALRPGSAAEAEAVGSLCARLSVLHDVVTWRGDKPKSGIMEAARAARYRLLLEACAGMGATCLVTAHTADDQVETVEMRLRRREDGSRGLSGIAPSSLFFGSRWVHRPFLSVRRSDIRHFLQTNGVAWIEDPSNDNRAFERVRVRQDGQLRRTAAEIAAYGDARAALAAETAELIRRCVTMPLPLLFAIDPAAGAGGDPFRLMLAMLIAVAGGQPHLPGAAQLDHLLARLGQGAASASLGRTVVERRRAFVFICRDRRNLPPGAMLPGEAWDGRLVMGGAVRRDVLVNPETMTPVPRAVSRRALDTLPPGLFGDRGEWPATVLPYLAPFEMVLPVFDLPVAQALARLTGRRPFPDPGLREVEAGGKAAP